MVVPFFVSLSSFSRDDDDDASQQAERELFVVSFVFVVFVFLSLVSFVMCEEKSERKPFSLFFFLFSLFL